MKEPIIFMLCIYFLIFFFFFPISSLSLNTLKPSVRWLYESLNILRKGIWIEIYTMNKDNICLDIWDGFSLNIENMVGLHNLASVSLKCCYCPPISVTSPWNLHAHSTVCSIVCIAHWSPGEGHWKEAIQVSFIFFLFGVRWVCPLENTCFSLYVISVD